MRGTGFAEIGRGGSALKPAPGRAPRIKRPPKYIYQVRVRPSILMRCMSAEQKAQAGLEVRSLGSNLETKTAKKRLFISHSPALMRVFLRTPVRTYAMLSPHAPL